MPDHARIALGLAPRSDQPDPTGPDRRPAAGPGSDTGEDEDSMQRRQFVGLTGASLFGALLTTPPRPSDPAESIAVVIAVYSPTAAAASEAPSDIATLATDVATAKRDYQACRYTAVATRLPALLAQLQAACTALGGPAQLRAWTLSAEAHHVAASILLKLGDKGVGWLSADRSMQAARASGDPITIGSSARIITHALMNSGHLNAAATTASTLAAELDHNVPAHTPESLSVYGSLLLRGAIAAAQNQDRRTANELLSEAETAGDRLGDDLNVRWTAFGPTNTRLHRVRIAVSLGDAGTALDLARAVSLDKIAITERKASFLVDTARAFLQCSKHERAYLTLRAAHQLAPEEIAGRSATRRVVRDLIATAPPTIRHDAAAFGQSIGVTP
jgi:hypothetical protein